MRVLTIGVGVGSGYSQSTLLEIVQNVPTNVFEAQNFNSLHTIIAGLHQVIEISGTSRYSFFFKTLNIFLDMNKKFFYVFAINNIFYFCKMS